MTDNLDTLRPEVRDALMHIRPDTYRFEINSWNCVRTELLRLTGDLNAARLSGETFKAKYQCMRDRAERAEGELAALKRRIEEAPGGVTRVCPYVVCVDVEGDEPYIIPAAKRVRLLVEE